MSRDIDDRKKRRPCAACSACVMRSPLPRLMAMWKPPKRPEPSSLNGRTGFSAAWEERLNTFGSAFADPEKGALDEPLSRLQAAKLKELEDKAKGKEPRPWKRSKLQAEARKGVFLKAPGPARQCT